MVRRPNYFSIFLFFLLLSGIVYGLSRTSIFGFLEQPVDFVTSPLQRFVYTFTRPQIGASQPTLVEKENASLRKQLVAQTQLRKENAALKDQFQTPNPAPTTLIPARIIGIPSYVPGVSWPTLFILDQGRESGIMIGQAVVYENNIVGQITNVSSYRSSVSLVSHPKMSFTAKTMSFEHKEAGQSASGIIKGQGEQRLLLDNVLLSERLKVSDMVLTQGDTNATGAGIPQDLVVGKIISIDKKPSALFQKAEVESLVDFSRLHTVFVITTQ